MTSLDLNRTNIGDPVMVWYKNVKNNFIAGPKMLGFIAKNINTISNTIQVYVVYSQLKTINQHSIYDVHKSLVSPWIYLEYVSPNLAKDQSLVVSKYPINRTTRDGVLFEFRQNINVFKDQTKLIGQPINYRQFEVKHKWLKHVLNNDLFNMSINESKRIEDTSTMISWLLGKPWFIPKTFEQTSTVRWAETIVGRLSNINLYLYQNRILELWSNFDSHVSQNNIYKTKSKLIYTNMEASNMTNSTNISHSRNALLALKFILDNVKPNNIAVSQSKNTIPTIQHIRSWKTILLVTSGDLIFLYLTSPITMKAISVSDPLGKKYTINRNKNIINEITSNSYYWIRYIPSGGYTQEQNTRNKLLEDIGNLLLTHTQTILPSEISKYIKIDYNGTSDDDKLRVALSTVTSKSFFQLLGKPDIQIPLDLLFNIIKQLRNVFDYSISNRDKKIFTYSLKLCFNELQGSGNKFIRNALSLLWSVITQTITEKDMKNTVIDLFLKSIRGVIFNKGLLSKAFPEKTSDSIKSDDYNMVGLYSCLVIWYYITQITFLLGIRPIICIPYYGDMWLKDFIESIKSRSHIIPFPNIIISKEYNDSNKNNINFIYNLYKIYDSLSTNNINLSIDIPNKVIDSLHDNIDESTLIEEFSKLKLAQQQQQQLSNVESKIGYVYRTAPIFKIQEGTISSPEKINDRNLIHEDFVVADSRRRIYETLVFNNNDYVLVSISDAQPIRFENDTNKRISDLIRRDTIHQRRSIVYAQWITQVTNNYSIFFDNANTGDIESFSYDIIMKDVDDDHDIGLNSYTRYEHMEGSTQDKIINQLSINRPALFIFPENKDYNDISLDYTIIVTRITVKKDGTKNIKLETPWMTKLIDEVTFLNKVPFSTSILTNPLKKPLEDKSFTNLYTPGIDPFYQLLWSLDDKFKSIEDYLNKFENIFKKIGVEFDTPLPGWSKNEISDTLDLGDIWNLIKTNDKQYVKITTEKLIKGSSFDKTKEYLLFGYNLLKRNRLSENISPEFFYMKLNQNDGNIEIWLSSTNIMLKYIIPNQSYATSILRKSLGYIIKRAPKPKKIKRLEEKKTADKKPIEEIIEDTLDNEFHIPDYDDPNQLIYLTSSYKTNPTMSNPYTLGDLITFWHDYHGESILKLTERADSQSSDIIELLKLNTFNGNPPFKSKKIKYQHFNPSLLFGPLHERILLQIISKDITIYCVFIKYQDEVWITQSTSPKTIYMDHISNIKLFITRVISENNLQIADTEILYYMDNVGVELTKYYFEWLDHINIIRSYIHGGSSIRFRMGQLIRILNSYSKFLTRKDMFLICINSCIGTPKLEESQAIDNSKTRVILSFEDNNGESSDSITIFTRCRDTSCWWNHNQEQIISSLPSMSGDQYYFWNEK